MRETVPRPQRLPKPRAWGYARKGLGDCSGQELGNHHKAHGTSTRLAVDRREPAAFVNNALTDSSIALAIVRHDLKTS